MSSPNGKCLIAVPTLNEAKHIAHLLEQLLAEAKPMDWPVVVIDGGSTDGTQAIVESFIARGEPVQLAHNPKRIQSAAMNRAVAQFGDGLDYVIRIDAHGDYPADYCRALVQEAQTIGADCVVVPMTTVGQNTFQRRGDGTEFAGRHRRLGPSHRQGRRLCRPWPPCPDEHTGLSGGGGMTRPSGTMRMPSSTTACGWPAIASG